MYDMCFRYLMYEAVRLLRDNTDNAYKQNGVLWKNAADVTICGNDYVLSGDKSEDKIKEIASNVDR